MLRDAGFILRTTFEEYGEADYRIVDPVIITSCGLLTTAYVESRNNPRKNRRVCYYRQSRGSEPVGTKNHRSQRRYFQRIIPERKTVHR